MENFLFKESGFKKWMTYCLLAFCTAAGAGVILRYKIAFNFPWIDQSNLLHAHSHFVMNTWVTPALCIALVSFVLRSKDTKWYKIIFGGMFIIGAGMLFSFAIGGYNNVSNVLSTISLVLFYIFGFKFIKDIKASAVSKHIKFFSITGIVFYLISSAGTLLLVYFMATQSITPTRLKLSTYWFLHFQYNGWYLFAIFALALTYINQLKIKVNANRIMQFFYFMLFATIFTYALSALPYYRIASLFILGGFGIALQLGAQAALLSFFLKNIKTLRNGFKGVSSLLIAFAALAFFLKSLLQAMSLIPSMIEIAASFRPIVIGYLHLVFIIIVSFFILAYYLAQGYLSSVSFWQKTGLILFICSAILSELLLMSQGLSFISLVLIGHFAEMLFVVTALMFTGLLIFTLSQNPVDKNTKIQLG